MALSQNAALAKDLRTGYATMQHRHFATIASIIRTLGGSHTLAEQFATELAYTNVNFDRDRFIAAATAR